MIQSFSHMSQIPLATSSSRQSKSDTGEKHWLISFLDATRASFFARRLYLLLPSRAINLRVVIALPRDDPRELVMRPNYYSAELALDIEGSVYDINIT